MDPPEEVKEVQSIDGMEVSFNSPPEPVD